MKVRPWVNSVRVSDARVKKSSSYRQEAQNLSAPFVSAQYSLLTRRTGPESQPIGGAGEDLRDLRVAMTCCLHVLGTR